MTPEVWAQIAHRYCEQVVDGTIPACELTVLACKRQLDDLQRPIGPDWPWRFDPAAGAKPCAFLSGLSHIKGKWARDRMRIKLEPWQVFSIMVPFGWVHHETGLRRFTEVYEEEPRKNAKSTKLAGLVLYMLGADDEHGAEVYTGATSEDQARLVFDDARRMALKEPALLQALGMTVTTEAIAVHDSASVSKPLHARATGLDGLNVHFAVLDEVHAMKSRTLYDVIDSARGAREQSLLWLITTAGVDRAGIGYERRTHAVQVLKGATREDRLFALIYTIDEDDDPHDPATWRKANPNFGVSVLPDDMAAASRKAQAMPSAMANFLTKRLNCWVTAYAAWMQMQAWDRCANPELRDRDLSGMRCFAGLDLASKVDIAAKVLLFEDTERDKVLIRCRFYLPEAAVERSANSQYDGWRRSGWLDVTDGEVTDFDAIEDDCREDLSTYNGLEALAFDPWQSAQMIGHLLDDGAPVVEVGQSVKNLSEAMKTVEAWVLQGKLEHDGNPVMTWMIASVITKRDARDNLYPVKEGATKIDGAVALFMAVNRYLASRAKPETDYSEAIVIS